MSYGTFPGANNRRPKFKVYQGSKPARASEEHVFQKQLVRTLSKHALIPRECWFSVPNGGARHPMVAMKLKAEGLLAGVADLCFILEGGRAAFLELKKAKGGTVSGSQKAFGEAVKAAGAQWECVNSIERAYWVLAEWGVLPGGVVQ